MTSLYEDTLYEDPMLARFYDLDNRQIMRSTLTGHLLHSIF